MASLACPRATCLRSLRVSNKFTVAGRSARAPFSISTSPTTKIPKLLISTTRPSIAAQLPCQALLVSSTVARRNASSTPTPASPSSTTTTSEEILTWDRFFDLRRKRRYINLVASLITAGAAVTVFGPIIAQQDIDGWAAQISGIDPIIVLGVTTFMVFGAGWLCGPSFGSAGFKVWAGRKGWNAAIAEKERSFYARIKRYRADPSSSSPQNPIPDYYGEKIASVKDYRRWLKDQRAFNLKKNKNMI